MLVLPDRGISRSIRVHNVDLGQFVDWIEASALVDQEGIAFSAVIDVLLEEQRYESQDFARELLASASREILRRSRALRSGYPFRLETNRLTPNATIGDRPDYAYCLEASLTPLYNDVKAPHGADILERGLLMEILTCSALKEMMPRWSVTLTGWSKQSPAKFSEIAKKVAELLWSTTLDLSLFAHRKEAGLDILCYRPFDDERGGFQSLMVQCATGTTDWKQKRKEPDFEIWRSAVSLPVPPLRAIAIPFALTEHAHKQSTVVTAGPVLDRFRLLQPSASGMAWLAADTQKSLQEWCNKRWPLYPRVETDA